MAEELGLHDHLDTMCGGPLTRGLSGGQKRRVSIGEQLVNLPRVLLLDEPTSGLDAAAAFKLIELLRDVSRKENISVVITIHQPSEVVLNMADRILLLSGGHTVYFGSTDGALTYFERQLGKTCPEHISRAEWMLNVVDTSFQSVEVVAPLIEAWPISRNAQKVRDTIEKMGVFNSGQTFDTTNSMEGYYHNYVVAHPPMLRQLNVLTRRQLIHMLYNPAAIWLRFAMYIALSIMIGTVWYDIGTDADVIQDVINVLFFIAAFMVFMSISVLPAFLDEKELFIKERSNGTVSAWSYSIAHFIVDAPFLFLLAVANATLCYWLTEMNDSSTVYGHFILNLWLSFVVAESLMMLIATIVPLFIVGIAGGAFAFGAFMVVQGFFIKIRHIGWWWRWMHYIALHTYSFANFMYKQFHDKDYKCVNGNGGMWQCTGDVVKGDDVLKLYEFEDTNVTENYIIMIAMAIGYRLLAAVWMHLFHTGKK